MSQMRINHRPSSLASYLVILLLISVLTQFSIVPMADAKKEKTHYDILELKQDAPLKDIKKAYRRLAVQHHPDRNLGNEEEATVKFREISEAYEVLSDEDSRREYDRALKGGGSFGNGSSGWSFSSTGDRQRRQHRRPRRDAFDQFNDVFQNDPFFKEAFKSMDDLFDRHFSNSNNGGGGSSSGSRKAQQRDTKTTVDTKQAGSGGGIWDRLKDFMPNVNVEIKTSSSSGGSTSYSSTSRSYGNSRSSSRSTSYSSSSSSSSSSNRRGGSSSSYTSRSTRTVIENGQRVTIQSLEKDGNKIEEKYIGEKLIERKINGVKEDRARIDEF